MVRPEVPRTRASAGRTVVSFSQRAQEVEHVLPAARAERVVAVDDFIRLGRTELRIAGAAMSRDRRPQVRRASIVQEEDALPQAPQRRRPEIVATCRAWPDVMCEDRPHLAENERG